MTEFEKLSLFYKGLAEQYLSEMYSLKVLEERLIECSVPFVPYQENAGGLQFLKMQNKAWIERMNDGERETLRRIYEENAEPEEIADFLKSTFRKVLAGALGQGMDYEFFSDIYGRGILPGQALVFCFRDKPVLDADGRIDIATERKKEGILDNAKRQFENMVEVKSGAMIRLVRI